MRDAEGRAGYGGVAGPAIDGGRGGEGGGLDGGHTPLLVQEPVGAHHSCVQANIF